MDDKKKTFTVPEAEIVSFVDQDIITVSAGVNWEEDDNTEVWG